MLSKPSSPSSLLVQLVLLIAAFLLFSNDCVAFSFPFRTFVAGDTVPAADFTDYKGKQRQSFADLRGKNVIAVFWGADLPEKKEHAVLILKQLQELTPFFSNLNVMIFSVNIQSDSPEVIDEVVKLSGSKSPVYVDPSQQAYSSLGIYVMPSMLLIDKSGKVAAGFGYSKTSVAHIKGEAEIMLGKKTRAQVDEENNPKVIEQSPERKQAIHRMNFATVMLKRGMNDAAIREFEQALTLDPKLETAVAELGCLYLETGNLPKAEETLARALTLNPDSLRVQTCAAQLKARQGKTAAAQAALEKLKSEHPDSPRIDYLLGRLWDEQAQPQKAAKLYREAFETLMKQHKSEGPSN